MDISNLQPTDTSLPSKDFYTSAINPPLLPPLTHLIYRLTCVQNLVSVSLAVYIFAILNNFFYTRSYWMFIFDICQLRAAIHVS